MNSKQSNYFWFILIVIFFAGCDYEFPTAVEPNVDFGTTDLSNISVVGGKSLSGFTDGALYNSGQYLSYPNIFVNHISSFSDSISFNQMNINSENGFNTEANSDYPGVNGKYKLGFRERISSWAIRQPEVGISIPAFTGDLNSINDFSIPNAKSYQIDDAQKLIGNPYYTRINGLGNNTSQLDLIISNSPSLIITDFGTDDIFNYALNGASGEDNPDENDIIALNNGLTPFNIFKESLEASIERMLNETGAEVFISSIPDPFLFPYFSDLLWYFNSAEFRSLRFQFSFFNDFNNSVNSYNETANPDSVRPIIDFDVDGGERFRAKVIEDEYLSIAEDEFGNSIPKIRQMTEEDYFLYNGEVTQYQSMIGTTEFGTTLSIPDRFVLTKKEQEIINDRRLAFNALIKQVIADNNRVHLLDNEKLIESVTQDLSRFNGTTFSLRFDHRGIVSADGYSLNPKGQALVANELINAINEIFSATIPLIDVNSFAGTNYVQSN